MSKKCLVITQDIKDLLVQVNKKYEGEFDDLQDRPFTDYVALWQERKYRQDHELPTSREIATFIRKQKQSFINNEKRKELNILNAKQTLAAQKEFSVATRAVRANVLARQFHARVLKTMRENPEMKSVKDVVNKKSGQSLFREVLNTYTDYLEKLDDNFKLNFELKALAKRNDHKHFTEEELKAKAVKMRDNRINEYNKIITHFDYLVAEACNCLRENENYVVSNNYTISGDYSNISESLLEQEEDLNDIHNREESVKEGWQIKTASAMETLSVEVKKSLGKIRLLDKNGNLMYDDLGHSIFVNKNTANTMLLSNLSRMRKPQDMMPILKQMAKQKSWVRGLIQTIEKDDSLKVKYYHSYRKEFKRNKMQRSYEDASGVTITKHKYINNPENVEHYLNEWANIIAQRNVLHPNYSIYDEAGNIIIDNAAKGMEKIGVLQALLKGISNNKDALILLHNKPEIFENISELLNMVGIDMNEEKVNAMLLSMDPKKADNPLKTLVFNLTQILSHTASGKLRDKVRSDGTVAKIDLMTEFGTRYKAIAELFKILPDHAVESSTVENNKMIQSHSAPSYLGNLIQALSDTTISEEEYQAYIEKEFKQYPWFYKPGKDGKEGTWLNSWIEELAAPPKNGKPNKAREMLERLVVAHRNGTEYTDLRPKQLTLMMFEEFNSHLNKDKANYHFPIYADAPSSEFVTFIRYNTDSEGTFKEKLLPKLTKLVIQEYNRINLVKQRDLAYQEGNPAISLLTNYDIVRDSSGNIIQKGGSEFAFLTELNDYTVFTEDIKGIMQFQNPYNDPQKRAEILARVKNGSNEDSYYIEETFLEALSRTLESNNFDSDEDGISQDNLTAKELIEMALTEIMDNKADAVYEEWGKLGLLEETTKGKLKLLPGDGITQENKNIIDRLRMIEKGFNEMKANGNYPTNLWKSSYANLLKALEKDPTRFDIADDNVYNNIKRDLTMLNATIGPNGNPLVANSFLENSSNLLEVPKGVKDIVDNYVWNSAFATSQIIQITTTDLAYYKGITDFQKRYKELYTMSNKLDTTARFNGELVGKEFERSVYLADEEMTSTHLGIAANIFYDTVKEGKMTAAQAEEILRKNTEANPSDAQAIRSIKSYRDVAVMAGKWDDNIEIAFKAVMAGTWNDNDLDIVMQVLKPFLYTQTAMESGVDPNIKIKVPTQNKNSEFMTIAMHAADKSPLGKSGKWRAINRFMMDNNIDVVQYESAVKVGKQGLINIYDKPMVLDQGGGISTYTIRSIGRYL